MNTNWHADHNFGNGFLPEEVQVVQHVNTAKHMAESPKRSRFRRKTSGPIKALTAIPRAADIEVSSDGWSVDLGNLTFEARDYGFAQTGGDLYFFVPEANVI